MQGRSAASICRWLTAFVVAALLPLALAADEDLQIVKPVDGSWLKGPEVEIIASGVDGRLLLDGTQVQSAELFPGVFHARIEAATGPHVLRLESAGEAREVRFHVGAPPARDETEAYVDHPPVRIDCTHCHSVSRRGRFRFSGGCQTCHAKEQFIQTHSHEPHELTSCGMCHDAHGSSVAKLLVMPREKACKQCHN